jgi:hypothetical protein
VFHKRYKHLVGTVLTDGYLPGLVYVLWSGFWYDQSLLEDVNDLRVTPVQPDLHDYAGV